MLKSSPFAMPKITKEAMREVVLKTGFWLIDQFIACLVNVATFVINTIKTFFNLVFFMLRKFVETIFFLCLGVSAFLATCWIVFMLIKVALMLWGPK